MPSSDQPEVIDAARPAGVPPAMGEGAVRYRVRHVSAYRYGSDIMLAHHLLHLAPRPVPTQRILSRRLAVDPEPAILSEHTDYFGNPTIYFELHAPHRRLAIEAEMVVEVAEPAFAPAEAATPWEDLAHRLGEPHDQRDRAAAVYGFGSAMVPLGAALRDYAAPSFTPGRAIGAAALDLTNRIHAEFTFDPEATTIATPVADVLRNRRGVCQDFAHLQIGCLRALGLPARYVSGYLRTIPPPGRPRAIGADVSHAWLSVWCGGDRWLDLDPTNGRAGSTDLIALAWGRDYGDISPTRGVILGSSIQQLTVSVDVALIS